MFLAQFLVLAILLTIAILVDYVFPVRPHASWKLLLKNSLPRFAIFLSIGLVARYIYQVYPELTPSIYTAAIYGGLAGTFYGCRMMKYQAGAHIRGMHRALIYQIFCGTTGTLVCLFLLKKYYV